MALFLVRHAVAVGRSSWDGADARRPLTPRGRRQSAALAALLAGAEVRRIHSSPAVRCRETVAPLARALDLKVRDADALAEGADARRSVALVRELAGKKGDSALCTHGDQVPEILRALAREGLHLDDELQFAKGSTWELAVDDGKLVTGRYHPPVER